MPLLLLPLPLFLLVILLLSPRDPFDNLGRTLGATITSASGAILANGEVSGGAGVSDVITILAVDVGDRCKAKGCMCSV